MAFTTACSKRESATTETAGAARPAETAAAPAEPATPVVARVRPRDGSAMPAAQPHAAAGGVAGTAVAEATAPTPPEHPATLDFSTGEFVTGETWGDAGRQTPEAAAQTWLWALRNGDTNRLAEVSGKKPDEANPDTGWQKDLQEVQAARVVPAAGGAPRQLLNAEGKPTEEIVMVMEYQLPNGTVEQGYMSVKANGTEWVINRVMGFPASRTTAQAK